MSEILRNKELFNFFKLRDEKLLTQKMENK